MSKSIERYDFRPYQKKFVDDVMKIVMPEIPALPKSNNCIAVAATGAGKTIMSVDFIIRLLKRANPTKDARTDPYAWSHDQYGQQILFIVDQKNLIRQSATKFRKVLKSMIFHDDRQELRGLEESITFIQGAKSYNKNRSIVIASRQTLANCYEKMIDDGDLRPYAIIYDECHSTNYCTTGRAIAAYKTAVGGGQFALPYQVRIGLTATPEYFHKKDNIADDWDECVVGPSHFEMIKLGALCPFLYYQYGGSELCEGITRAKGKYGGFVEEEVVLRFNSPHRIEFALNEWGRITEGKEKTIVFPVNIAHGEAIIAAAKEKGHVFKLISYKTPDKEREKIVEAFDNHLTLKGDDGPPIALVAVDALKKGFDSVVVQAIMDMAPTMSLTSHGQKYGRGSRPGTEFCRIFDFVGNIDRMENLYQKGYPDLVVHDRDTVLGIKPYNPNHGGGEAPMKQCPLCDRANYASAARCMHDNCDHEFAYVPKTEGLLTGQMYQVTRKQDVNNLAKAKLFYRSCRIRAHSRNHIPMAAWYEMIKYEEFAPGSEFSPPPYTKCSKAEKDAHREWTLGSLLGNENSIEFAITLKNELLHNRDRSKFTDTTINEILWQEFVDEVYDQVKIGGLCDQDAKVNATNKILDEIRIKKAKKAAEAIASDEPLSA